jgi:hypothetical protein
MAIIITKDLPWTHERRREEEDGWMNGFCSEEIFFYGKTFGHPKYFFLLIFLLTSHKPFVVFSFKKHSIQLFITVKKINFVGNKLL